MFEFDIKDLLDIFLVAVILFSCYKLMKQSRSVNIFYGLLVFISFWIIISKVVEMKLLGSILDQLVSVGVIAIIVLFQEEIRHFFFSLGTHERANRIINFFRPKKDIEDGEVFRHSRAQVSPIVLACLNMAKQKVGALIVMQNDLPLGDFVRTGERIDALVSQRLIENIFFKNSPLHDGALIINGDRLVAASCILPVSHDLDIPKDFGLRHRAAKGLSKETDALAIVVSEETGRISVAYDNDFKARVSAEELERILMKGKI
jgi:uncharacterized protein (TIGR00159 family)